MDFFWYIGIFLFGSIVGSFLNVVIYRLHTSKSLNGRSHCMSCGKLLEWYELFPILSYLVLKGKCRGCASYIPSRYLVVELITGLLFVIVWRYVFPDLFLTALNLMLVSVLVVIAVYDIRHTIIPDELVVMTSVLSVAFLGYGYLITGETTFVIWNIIGGIGAAFFFWCLWFISKGRWIGLGDAKLALPLGIIVGFGGVFSMVVLSFWIGAGVSLMLLFIERLLKRGKKSLHFLSTPLTIKSEVPFAPFMILGFFLVQFLHADIFALTYALFFSE